MDHKGNILLIDDVPTILLTLESLLKQEGYSIHKATNGIDGIAKAEEILPDLILLDVVMPDMNGYEVCEYFKSHSQLRLIPIIFLTGKTTSEDIVKGFECGCVDYISKPFNITELKARVKTHISLKHARDEIATLRGIIPICSCCKKIRDDSGYWGSVETYIQQHTEAQFSHGYCPTCEEKEFGDKSWWQNKKTPPETT